MWPKHPLLPSRVSDTSLPLPHTSHVPVENSIALSALIMFFVGPSSTSPSIPQHFVHGVPPVRISCGFTFILRCARKTLGSISRGWLVPPARPPQSCFFFCFGFRFLLLLLLFGGGSFVSIWWLLGEDCLRSFIFGLFCFYLLMVSDPPRSHSQGESSPGRQIVT